MQYIQPSVVFKKSAYMLASFPVPGREKSLYSEYIVQASMVIMPRCACASEVYGVFVCLSIVVSMVCLCFWGYAYFRFKSPSLYHNQLTIQILQCRKKYIAASYGAWFEATVCVDCMLQLAAEGSMKCKQEFL